MDHRRHLRSNTFLITFRNNHSTDHQHKKGHDNDRIHCSDRQELGDFQTPYR